MMRLSHRESVGIMAECVYMVATTDQYELPICVGTAQEIADFLGIKIDTVYQYNCPSRGHRRRNKKYQIIRVEAEDEEFV